MPISSWATIRIVARDLTEPSPLAREVLTARPYAYLDDAPLEERRTQAVMSRRWLDPASADEIGRLDEAAVARVREEAWPDAASPDELHDALVWLGFLTEAEADAREDWKEWLIGLQQSRRATLITAQEGVFWVPAERLRQVQAAYPDAALDPVIAAPASADQAWESDAALVELVRGRLEGQGPTTLTQLAGTFGLPPERISAALTALEVEGFALAGTFTPGGSEREWCERRLLARIHRYTVKRLRAEIEPVPARDYLRFLFDWQGVSPDAQREGSQALDAVIEQLAGFEAPAAAWEGAILPARMTDYEPGLLDDACLSGRVAWARLGAAAKPKSKGQANGTAEIDADHSVSAQYGLRLGAAARRRTCACERQSAESGGVHWRERRLFLRRDRRRHPSPPHAGRGGARRACRRRAGRLGQFWWLARLTNAASPSSPPR